ncbi:MAG: TetR/AcrR family transcriptional regulator, partial [Acutalibacteraceae bacterium]|nr:TetR/AcrR family transcriptional regulator [Acutalibacteraceae bacterium]
MNDKFFALPIEKQRRIINAAYRVFSENSYKKA